MKTRDVSFPTDTGQDLRACIYLPFVGRPKAFAIFVHCFNCVQSSKAVDLICNALTGHHIGVLSLDFSGSQQEDCSHSLSTQDLISAYTYLEDAYAAPQILIGHSLGGLAAMLISKELETVRAVVTIGAPASFERFQNLDEKMKTAFLGDCSFLLHEQLLEQFGSSFYIVREMPCALLIAHSPQDMVVDIANAADIYASAMHPKSFLSLDGADHMLTRELDAAYLGSMICPWASRYVDFKPNELAPEGEVWTRLFGEDFFTEVIAGEHHLQADEPEDSGGKNLGPSPYDYLLAALGSCTAMTLRMYATHKKLDLKEVMVKLTHDKIHKRDTEAADKSVEKIDRIRRQVELYGNLTPEQRNRLMQIAEKCPVHKTIVGKPEIITEEVMGV